LNIGILLPAQAKISYTANRAEKEGFGSLSTFEILHITSINIFIVIM
jgi:hypothetical protein